MTNMPVLPSYLCLSTSTVSPCVSRSVYKCMYQPGPHWAFLPALLKRFYKKTQETEQRGLVRGRRSVQISVCSKSAGVWRPTSSSALPSGSHRRGCRTNGASRGEEVGSRKQRREFPLEDQNQSHSNLQEEVRDPDWDRWGRVVLISASWSVIFRVLIMKM